MFTSKEQAQARQELGDIPQKKIATLKNTIRAFKNKHEIATRLDSPPRLNGSKKPKIFP